MTSSTVSITANPCGACLRRPILTGDKISGDGIDPASGSKDLSNNSTRACTETVLERCKEILQTKNPNSTNSKLRKRTAVKKSKPAWKTVVWVIFKILNLLVILGTLARWLGLVGDHERRIAKVEESLETTGKMMQVHVEVVDRKIDNEIAGLKTEVGMLDGRVEEMEKVSKLDELWEDLTGNGDVGETKLDAIRAFAKEIVAKEIEKHAADGLGKVDYAVATGGGSVLRHSEAFVSSSSDDGWFAGNVKGCCEDAATQFWSAWGVFSIERRQWFC